VVYFLKNSTKSLYSVRISEFISVDIVDGI